MDRRSRETATLCHCSSSACCPWTEEAAWTLRAGPGLQSSGGGRQERGAHFGFPLSCKLQQALPTPLKRRRRQWTPPGHGMGSRYGALTPRRALAERATHDSESPCGVEGAPFQDSEAHPLSLAQGHAAKRKGWGAQAGLPTKATLTWPLSVPHLSRPPNSATSTQPGCGSARDTLPQALSALDTSSQGAAAGARRQPGSP